ncbi:hypothetical protein HZB78_04400 [Candidatus Collierbacteria bacterium]|nr:hypothetical protein [Candidatus Collierbacteria bacterium]
MKKISPASTKTELWEGYQELIKQVESRGETTPIAPTKSLRTATESLQAAVTTLVSVKTSIDEGINKLEQQRQQQLEDEQKAQDELRKFQEDMKRAKQELDYELKRTRQEKLDELEIDLKTKRRAHEEAVSQEKQVLQLKKEELSGWEKEFNRLKKLVEEFPAQLDKAVKQAAEAAGSEEQQKAKTAKDLLEKQVDGEKALSSLRIQTLEKNVKDQAEEIRALKSQLEQATRQVKDIAVSVIDSRRPAAETKSSVS